MKAYLWNARVECECGNCMIGVHDNAEGIDISSAKRVHCLNPGCSHYGKIYIFNRPTVELDEAY